MATYNSGEEPQLGDIIQGRTRKYEVVRVDGNDLSGKCLSNGSTYPVSASAVKLISRADGPIYADGTEVMVGDVFTFKDAQEFIVTALSYGGLYPDRIACIYSRDQGLDNPIVMHHNIGNIHLETRLIRRGNVEPPKPLKKKDRGGLEFF